VRDVDALGIKVEDRAEVELLVDGVSRSMERGKDREIANMRRGLSALATIASSAPFVGLFGTVFGIITAFQNMADPSKGGGGLATVSAGISEALLTTAVGLAVAIVSVWFYNYFTARVEELTIDVDETAGEILDTMVRDARLAFDAE
jgi:biopolymer transport protein ExbB/TolQ